MLAGMPSSVSVPPVVGLVARSGSGPACPRCDTPTEGATTICGACGMTLGEPPRRSGMTQRALALDESAAQATLDALARREPAAPAPVPTAPVRVVRSGWDVVLVVLTLGLGWLWLRRRRSGATTP
jgi:hypothetical protein